MKFRECRKSKIENDSSPVTAETNVKTIIDGHGRLHQWTVEKAQSGNPTEDKHSWVALMDMCRWIGPS